MTDRPIGMVTFLFTDIEQSTRRWEEDPDAMRTALAAHDATLRQAVEDHGGWLFKHTGDGVLAAFARARPAIEAAIAAQRKLELPVRMGICTGEVEARDGDYFGPALNRSARTMAAAHGGQIVVAASTAAIVDDVALIDLGEYRLRDLSHPQRLFQVKADGLQESFPRLRTLDVSPGNLPAQTTSFLGRDKELVEVVALLREARLLTLTGVGGVGKTRLAIQVAAETSANYRDGAWFVELAGIADPAAIGHVVAAVLGVAQQPGRTIEQSIASALAGQQLLLVLDNCEHLIDAAAALAGRIITQCKQVDVLATSREALMVDGERIHPVPSLGFRDGAQSPAVALFADRARSVAPDFAISSDEEAISEICRRLDGIPLAIELAAARVRAMSPVQIRDRLDERFRLLTGGSRRALERHQTLRHAVQWSYDLLSPAERSVLNRASVFSGGFALEAAERVCAGGDIESADILDISDSLVRKSLVTVERSGSVIRYGLLETIRQFAEEQLIAAGESEAVRIRHAETFADDSDAKFELWLSPRQAASYDWLDREVGNLRAAFRWAKDHDELDTAARIASNVGDMARFRMREEAANWAEEIVDAARAANHRRLAILLTWAASSAWSFGRMDDAKRYGNEAISLAGRPGFDRFVWAFADLAMVATYEGDIARAIELIRAGSEFDADKADRFCLAFLLYFTAASGRIEEAMQMAANVVAATEATGIPSSISLAYWAKGEAFAASDPVVALHAYEHALAVARGSGNRFWELMVIPKIAGLQARRGDPVAALHGFIGMLNASRRSADRIFATFGIGSLIVLLERLGESGTAATLHGALSPMFDASAFLIEFPEVLARLRRALGDEAFEEHGRKGASLAQHEVADYALDQINRAIEQLDVTARRAD
ncbi:ATP-binding protein [Bradyrhizobium sp.]